jgi:hypothetical protein
MATDAEVIVRKRNSAGRSADDTDSVITARRRRRHRARSVVNRRSMLLGLNLNPRPSKAATLNVRFETRFLALSAP